MYGFWNLLAIVLTRYPWSAFCKLLHIIQRLLYSICWNEVSLNYYYWLTLEALHLKLIRSGHPVLIKLDGHWTGQSWCNDRYIPVCYRGDSMQEQHLRCGLKPTCLVDLQSEVTELFAIFFFFWCKTGFNLLLIITWDKKCIKKILLSCEYHGELGHPQELSGKAIL